jgi:hypothetical protein
LPLHSPPPPPALELRTLRPDPAGSAFLYSYEICAKAVLGICTERKIAVDRYDWNDPEVRKALAARGFVLEAEAGKPIP